MYEPILNLTGLGNMSRLSASRAPNLPMAPGGYSPQFVEQVNNALRLYFTKKDLNESALLGPLGGQFINSPHIAATDSTDQYALGSNVATIVKWNTLEVSAGFTLNIDGTATLPVSGTYKIDYSLQLTNTDNVAHDAFVWLVVNGVPVRDTSSRFTVSARKSATEFAHVVAYSSATFAVNGNDVFALCWATDQAATSDALTAGIYLEHIPAQTTPYVRPSNPSAVGSIVFVSCPNGLS